MAALQGAYPTLSTPADALQGGFMGQPVTTPTALEGARPGVISTYNVPVTAGFIGAFEIDGEVVASASPGATEFSRDLVSVDPTDGSITVTAGAHTTDQSAGSAAKPALPAGDVELFTMLASDAAVTEVEQAARGTGLANVFTVEVKAGEIDGVQFEAETLTLTLSSASEFARDLVSIDPDTGAITLTVGAETSDQTSGSAVAASTPAGEAILAEVLVSDSALTVEYDNRGGGLETDTSLSVAVEAGMVDGVAIAAQDISVVASGGSNWAKDLVSVDAAGALTVTAGTEAASLGAASIADCPSGDVGLFAVGVGPAASGATTLYLAGARGLDPIASE